MARDRSILARAVLAIGLACFLTALTSSCVLVTYQVSRTKSDTPVDTDRFLVLRPGETPFVEAIAMLGSPDDVRVGWDDAGERFTWVEYHFGKRRASDLAFRIPIEQFVTYNTGIRFIQTFLGVIRGESVVPSELETIFRATAADVNDVETTIRLSDRGDGYADLTGEALRLSDLRGNEQVARPSRTENRPLTLEPLALGDASQGIDRIRLRFDANGILTLKEFRRNTPSTNVGAQLRDSVLQ